jgi:hypothetical protein
LSIILFNKKFGRLGEEKTLVSMFKRKSAWKTRGYLPLTKAFICDKVEYRLFYNCVILQEKIQMASVMMTVGENQIQTTLASELKQHGYRLIKLLRITMDLHKSHFCVIVQHGEADKYSVLRRARIDVNRQWYPLDPYDKYGVFSKLLLTQYFRKLKEMIRLCSVF